MAKIGGDVRVFFLMPMFFIVYIFFFVLYLDYRCFRATFLFLEIVVMPYAQTSRLTDVSDAINKITWIESRKRKEWTREQKPKTEKKKRRYMCIFIYSISRLSFSYEIIFSRVNRNEDYIYNFVLFFRFRPYFGMKTCDFAQKLSFLFLFSFFMKLVFWNCDLLRSIRNVFLM